MWLKWRWSWAVIAATAGVFIVIDSILFSATLTKFFSGGAMPVTLAIMIFTALTTWKRGQMALNGLFSQRSIPIERFIKEVHRNPPIRVPGTAIFMTPYHNVVPDSLLQNLKHNRMLHERVIFLTLTVQEIPHVSDDSRIRIRTLGDNFYQLEVHFGFNDVPDMSDAYNYCLKRGMDFDNIHQTSFYLGRETIIPLKGGIMALWRERIFAIMKQNASSAVEYYNIPYDRVVEIGGRYEL
jgi:KUP system potassium uptake protein